MWDLWSISCLWNQGRPTFRPNIALNHNLPYHANADDCSMYVRASRWGTQIYFISFHLHVLSRIFTTFRVLHSPLNMKLLGKFEVVKLHLYKYWMMPGMEASTGTVIDFISLSSWTSNQGKKWWGMALNILKSFRSWGLALKYLSLSLLTFTSTPSPSFLMSIKRSKCREKKRQFI